MKSHRANEKTTKEGIDDKNELLSTIRKMVLDMKKTLVGDFNGNLSQLETMHITTLESRVDQLRAKLISQGLRQFCRYTERKNRLNLRYFLRKASKAK